MQIGNVVVYVQYDLEIYGCVIISQKSVFIHKILYVFVITMISITKNKVLKTHILTLLYRSLAALVIN